MQTNSLLIHPIVPRNKWSRDFYFKTHFWSKRRYGGGPNMGFWRFKKKLYFKLRQFGQKVFRQYFQVLNMTIVASVTTTTFSHTNPRCKVESFIIFVTNENSFKFNLFRPSGSRVSARRFLGHNIPWDWVRSLVYFQLMLIVISYNISKNWNEFG